MELESDARREKETNFHVLAVDDSLIDRKLLERLLRVSSYKVTCVESGDKALKYLGLNDAETDLKGSSSSHQNVNLIMTDYCMPGMTGFDLLKRLKGSSWKDVPVVIMSSENVPSRVKMCLEEGAEEFLMKPLQLSDMKRLQPYLLKSLEHSCKSRDKNQPIHTRIINREDKDQTVKSKNNNGSDNDKEGVVSSKRKAVSPDPPENKRPNIKQLAVI